MSETGEFAMIVAMSRDGAIGDKGDLLCHLRADLKHFKAITSGHTVIMGRKTYDSLPNGALPNRRNIVITRNDSFNQPSTERAASIDEALDMTATDDKRFLIGGASIYDAAIGRVDKLYLTLIDSDFPDADTRLHNLHLDEWEEVSREDFLADENNEYPYSFITLVRKRL